MGHTTKQIEIGHLPDNEGILRILQSDTGPEVTDKTLLQDQLLLHGDISEEFGMSCDKMKFVSVSSKKKVLWCVRCGLRICLPREVTTLGELKEYWPMLLMNSLRNVPNIS